MTIHEPTYAPPVPTVATATPEMAVGIPSNNVTPNNYEPTARPSTEGYDQSEKFDVTSGGGFPGAGNRPQVHNMCSKCGASYALPHGARSWRCTGCGTFNSLDADECPCCAIC